MLGDGTPSSSRAMIIEAIKEIYGSVAANYDQLVREKEARKNAILRRLHLNSAPLVNAVAAPSQSLTVSVPSVQPATALVDKRETGISWWIYGCIIVSVGLFIGGWFIIRFKK